MDLSHNELKRNFKDLMKHCVELASAFKLVDPGTSTAKKNLEKL